MTRIKTEKDNKLADDLGLSYDEMLKLADSVENATYNKKDVVEGFIMGKTGKAFIVIPERYLPSAIEALNQLMDLYNMF